MRLRAENERLRHLLGDLWHHWEEPAAGSMSRPLAQRVCAALGGASARGLPGGRLDVMTHAFCIRAGSQLLVIRAVSANDLARQVVALAEPTQPADADEAARRAIAMWEVHVSLNLCGEECGR